MFKGLGTWLGLESPAHVEPAEEEEEEEEKEVKVVEAQEEVNKQQQQQEEKKEEEEEEENKEAGQEQQEQESVSGKGLGDYFFSFASSASKKISESVVETAQTIKKTVEEGKIDGIIDKTFLGDFQKEQEKFVQEKKAKKSEAAVPPWVGYNEEETIQQQILSLSADKRNFLRDPPAGVQFHFEMEHMYPLAAVMLEEDELLNRMRFDLVPKLVKEEVFWRNYFYRVSLIKQSAQLTALAAQQQKDSEDRDRTPGVTPEDAALPEVRQKTPPVSICSLPEPAPEEEEISTSPGVSEFVSDGFETTPFNQEDLWKEMEQMVLDLNGTAAEVPEESSEWGKEMLQELQDYEMVPEEGDDQLQQELENILSAEEIRDINLSLNG